MLYACPCCGFFTYEEVPGGTFFICPVCYWEDDEVQNKDPNFQGGANKMSLNEAKENFKKIGAVSKEYVKLVRSPLQMERQLD